MISLSDIQAAQERLSGLIIRTPLVFSQTLSRMYGVRVFLKLENLQTTGSFKLRGSLNKIKLLPNASRTTGVVAASAGNHAQGVAYAASLAGIPATVVMPQWASLSKQLATEGYGGLVLRHGQDLTEALAKAQELADTGLTFIHPYDDPQIIAGQGTLGLEIMADLPEVETILIPVGGGGLAAGVALALKSIKPSVRIIGVQARLTPSAQAARETGRPVPVPSSATLADGINVTCLGQQTFPILQEYLDDLVLVSESEIADAVLLLLEKKKILCEGAGAVPAAALTQVLKDRNLGRRLVLLISGGNIDIPLLERVVQRGLINSHRLLTVRVILPDSPGSLGRLTTLLGQAGANILHLDHDRLGLDLPLKDTRVYLALETKGPQHCQEIRETLADAGYLVDNRV
ncbi:threonine ammonia-lyase [Desulfobacca acetoxidans]|uniref:Threonine dehydratase n=1 Tax=Desulfobacca acetoxidans (strain ATCC 700848 / DSM 11109 / ASRB2) TaxID=880072 RepID=F2NH37_DESAR|nr:threonine ammonia-lyase [Desulfobacca acetoxidans]AEB08808.1 threonine dehydratase [Desulfobacca acetoxidans DSM 11109]